MTKYQEALDKLTTKALYYADRLFQNRAIEIEIEIKQYNETIKELVDKETPTFVVCNEWRGTRLTRYMCPKCNKQVRNDEEYCHKCGKHIKFPKIKVADNKAYLDWE